VEEKKIERISSKPFKKLNLFSLLPRVKSERNTREKTKKKYKSPNPLSVSQNFAVLTSFFFPLLKNKNPFSWENFFHHVYMG